MKLSFKERIILGGVLPTKGTFESLLILDDVRKKIVPSQQEIKDFEVTTHPNGFTTWNNAGTLASFEIKFSEPEKNEIAKVYKKLSEEGNLDHEHLELYKKFVK